MAEDINSGIFTVPEFQERATLKLAPDALLVLNGALGDRVVTTTENTDLKDNAVNPKTSKEINFKSGITSINITHAIRPAGSGRCEITIVCPQYEGIHQDYYITEADGTRVPYFTTMMEVKVYMKGRYLASGKAEKPNAPLYYPVFWGFITGMNESYSGGQVTFQLSCQDTLSWWRYQNVQLLPTGVQQKYGAAGVIAPTIFYNLNAWQVIWKLFEETGAHNFVYPSFMDGGSKLPAESVLPDWIFNAQKAGEDTISDEVISGGWTKFRDKIQAYWSTRFGLDKETSPGQKANNASNLLEMYGLRGLVSYSDDPNTSKSSRKSVSYKGNIVDDGVPKPEDLKKGELNTATSIKLDKDRKGLAGLDMDFGALGRVASYSSFSQNKASTEPIESSKLEIAQKVADDARMEFFLDVNGRYVFKPPFYNLDVSRHDSYRIKADDIISFSDHFESTVIVNFLEVTGPMLYTADVIRPSGLFIDFGSVMRFGPRTRKLDLAYGNTSEELMALAAGEMALINAQATTGSIEIPLRPEIRLGYPVYIDHIDSYYYVSGISHSFNFGSQAVTTLTLEAKREKVRDGNGDIRKGHIYKSQKTEPTEDIDKLKDSLGKQSSRKAGEMSAPETRLQEFYESRNMTTSMSPGFYDISEADAMKQFLASKGPVDQTEIDLAELVTYTLTKGDRNKTDRRDFKTTTPFTDINGYRHIGAFPYGANMSLSDDNTIQDNTKVLRMAADNIATKKVANAAPIGSEQAVDAKQKAKTPQQSTVEGADSAQNPSSNDSTITTPGMTLDNVAGLFHVPVYDPASIVGLDPTILVSKGRDRGRSVIGEG